VNELRLIALSAYQAEIGPTLPLEVKKVARCLIEPALRAASDPTHSTHFVARLLMLARTLSARART